MQHIISIIMILIDVLVLPFLHEDTLVISHADSGSSSLFDGYIPFFILLPVGRCIFDVFISQSKQVFSHRSCQYTGNDLLSPNIGLKCYNRNTTHLNMFEKTLDKERILTRHPSILLKPVHS